MSRYTALMDELNKNVKVDESSGSVIQGWSPNNVRRIVIGHSMALVQYHKTNSNYKNLVELVDFRGLLEADLKKVSEEPRKYKGLLKVLTDGRVCSSIEEIYFIMDKMPVQLYNIDSDLTILGTSLDSVRTRFPRLSHISQVWGVTPQQMAQSLAETNSEYSLVLPRLLEQRFSVKYIAEVNRGDWWRSYSLRPKYYTMDTDTLRVLFERVKETYANKQAEQEQTNADKEEIKAFINDFLPRTIKKIAHHATTAKQCKDIFDKISIISKAEWGKTLFEENMSKHARKELNSNPDRIKAVRSINFDYIGNIIQSEFPEKLNEYGVMHKYITETVFEKYLPHVDPYKRESNKSEVKLSLKDLDWVANQLVILQHKEIYLAFAKYLNRNTPKHAPFYYDLLQYHPEGLRYTRPISEYCNKYMTTGDSAEVFRAVSMVLVNVDDFKPSDIMQDTGMIVKALSTAE